MKTPSSDCFQIDRHRLDDEWVNQPVYMHHFAVRAAKARNRLELAKNELKLTEANVAKDIRSNPEDYDIVKVTDKAIEAAMISSKEYQDAIEEVTDAKYALDRLQAKVDAMEHKKKALESLVYLHGQDYFSSPSITKATPEAMEKVSRDRTSVKGIRPKK